MRYSQSGILKDTRPWGKMFVAGAAAVTLSVAIFASAFAAPQTELKCFSGSTDGGYNGTCVLNGSGATIDTTDGDLDPNNNYAGVYYENISLSGMLVGDVDALSFDYAGTGAVGGSPRLSIPVDSTGDGNYDAFVYVDTVGCNDGNANIGTLDVVNNADCAVAYGNTVYADWGTFAALNPTLTIATDTIPFVIVDQPGDFVISNVVIGKQTDPKAVCMNGGWKTYEGKTFKNQGQCVSFVVANDNASFKRPVVE